MAKKQKSQFLLALGMAFVAVTLFAFHFLAQTATGTGEDLMVEVRVAPSVLARRGSGEWLTVYAGVPTAKVMTSTLRLNGIGVVKTGSDGIGNLVAYFDQTRVRAAITADQWTSGSVQMILTGDLWDGGTLTGAGSVALKK